MSVKSQDKMRRGMGMVFGGNQTAAQDTEKESQSIQSIMEKPLGKVEILEEKSERDQKPGSEKMPAQVIQSDQKERSQPFNLHIPETLHARLKFFVDNHALRHESMTKIILTGLENHLKDLEIRAGIWRGEG